MTLCPSCGATNIEGVDNCELCGQSLTDLAANTTVSVLEQQLVSEEIRALKPTTPIVVAPTATVREVIQLMVDKSIGCVLIVEDGKLVGVFSERDVLLKLNVDYEQFLDQPVSDFMTPDPQTLVADSKIAFAVQRMDLGGYRHLPIVESDGTLIGMISVRDILNYLTNAMSGDR